MDRRSFAHQALYGWQFHDTPTYCRNGNMAYKGNFLVSYNTVIGVYDKKHGFTILTPYYLSSTTAQHKSIYNMASPYDVFYLSFPTTGSVEFYDIPDLELDGKDKYSFTTKAIRSVIDHNLKRIENFIVDVYECKDPSRSYESRFLSKEKNFYKELIRNVRCFYEFLIKKKIIRQNKKTLELINKYSEKLNTRRKIIPGFWSLKEKEQLSYIKKRILIYIDDNFLSNDFLSLKRSINMYVNNRDSCGLYHFLQKAMNKDYLSNGILKYIKCLACINDSSLRRVENDICFFSEIHPDKERIISSKGFCVSTKTVKFLIKNFWRNQGRDITFKQVKIDNYNFDIYVHSSHIRIGCHIIPYFVVDNLKKQIELSENQ